MWKLDWLLMHATDAVWVNEKGEYVPAKPTNAGRDWSPRTLRNRIKWAWEVFRGRADAFTWPEVPERCKLKP
jgi:hypothetical protein